MINDFEFTQYTIANLIEDSTRLFEEIQKFCLSGEKDSSERAQKFLELCRKNPALFLIICGSNPKNEGEALAALTSAREFFSIVNNPKGLKDLRLLLCKRPSGSSEKQVQSELKILVRNWDVSKTYLTIKSLSSIDELANFAHDVDKLVELNVSRETASRILSKFYQISQGIVYEWLKKSKTKFSQKSPHAKFERRNKKTECEKKLQLRKRCMFEILLRALRDVRKEDLTAKEIAKAIFTAAVVCSQLKVWKEEKEIGWWINTIEKLIAGKTVLIRREAACSPNK